MIGVKEILAWSAGSMSTDYANAALAGRARPALFARRAKIHVWREWWSSSGVSVLFVYVETSKDAAHVANIRIHGISRNSCSIFDELSDCSDNSRIAFIIRQPPLLDGNAPVLRGSLSENGGIYVSE